MGQEGTKDRLDMVSREPTWAKKVKASLGQEGAKDGLKRAGKEGTMDRLVMVLREPTWAKKVTRID